MAQFRVVWAPVVVAALVCALAGGCARSAGRHRDRIYRIGYSEDFPWDFTGADGKPAGLSVDLVREAARRRGIQLAWTFDQDALGAITNGKADLWVQLTMRPERRGIMHITEPFLTTESTLIVPADSQIRSFPDLRRSRIAGLNLDAIRRRLRQALPECTFVPVDDPREAIRAVSDGRADAAFLDQFTASAVLLVAGNTQSLRMFTSGLPRVMFGVGSTFEAQNVADEVRDEMRSMSRDGTVQQIAQRWGTFATTDEINDVEREHSQNRVLWAIVAGLSILTVLAGVLAWRLRVQQRITRARERALRMSEERWQLAVKSTSDGIWDYNPLTDEVFYSDRYQEMLGYSPGEFPNSPAAWREQIHPDDVEWVSKILDDHMAGKTPFYRAEYRMRTKSGDYRWILSRGTALRDAEGKAIRFTGQHTDITEQRLAEAALLEAERQYREIFDSAIEGIFRATPNGRALTVNASFARILGYESPAEIEAMPPEQRRRDLWFDAREREAVTALMDTSTHGEVLKGECRLRRKDGSPVWVSFSARAIVDAEGRTRHFEGFIDDLTERRATEEALRRAEAQYRLVSENISDFIWIADTETRRYLYVSPSVERLLGYEAGEMMTRVALEPESARSCGDAAPFRPDRIAEFMRGSRQSYADEVELRRRDGSAFQAEITFRYLLNPETGHIEMYGVTRDVSERRRVQNELAATNLRLRMALASARLGTWDRDLETGTAVWDDRMYEMFGVTGDSSVDGAALWRNAVHPDDLAPTLESLEAAVRGERKFDVEYRIVRPDGTIRHLRGEGIVLRDSQGKALRVIGLNRDVTEQKQAEEERARLENQLAQAQKMESIGRFAGGVAHDFNNLLTVINGQSQMALETLPAGEEVLRHRLEGIYKAGERAAQLTRQLLAFSRKQMLEPRVLDLNGVVAGMKSLLQRMVTEDVQIQIALNAEPLPVRADLHQFEQVIMNLAVNARQAMPRGGRLLIETALLTRGRDPQKYAMLAVSDTGTGMDAATRERIFEPFFTTKGPEGTGLGLSMVQGIVEQSGGEIEVSSQPELGTTFRIYLPALAGLESAGSAPEPEQQARGSEKVLLVEDQEEVREFLGDALKKQGYSVMAASGGEEALALCEREGGRIDLLLTDVVMPNMSGAQLAAKLTGKYPRVRVLYMSGFTGRIIERHGLAPGAGFIQKPFSPDQLSKKIREVLESPVSTAPVP
ncbi:MAG TPA: PAS domain-containing protein [Bryobacteraceae bacterium]|nr:PAS domain-containing protein [Bryobacteraceae bacterium]